MKNKMVIFIKLMQKYSQVFSNISDKIFTSDKTKIENIGIEYKAKKELKKTVKQFNNLLFNPKLSENIFQTIITDIDNKNNENDILEENNNLLSNNINNLLENEKDDISKEDINNLIEKYESKINILLSENDILKMNKDSQTTLQNDLIFKNNDLEKENNELKLSLNEYNIKYDNLLSQYNDLKNKMIRIENDNSILIKENQELKNDILNLKNEINPDNDINFLKNELSYKNSIIKYLEQMIYCNSPKEIEDSLREEYEKNIKKIKRNSDISESDLNIGDNKMNDNKKNSDKKDKNKNNINNNNINNNKKLKINEQLLINSNDSNEDFENKNIDLEYSNDNVNQIDNNLFNSKEYKKEKEKEIDLDKNKNNKNNKNNKALIQPNKIKKEIEIIDEEIIELQRKFKEMIQK